MKIGSYFEKNGIYRLSDGAFCAVEGNRVLGISGRDCLVSKDVSMLSVLRAGRTSATQLPLLAMSPNAVLLVFAFVLLTLVRSAVIDAGIDFQGVLFITGPQGIGKTCLARRIAGFVNRQGEPPHRPALFFDAGSTPSAIRDAMSLYRDLPLIIDDLCISASPRMMQRRLELTTQIVREATNAADIVKKSSRGELLRLQCVAGVVFTAEILLNSRSELTRLILVPLDQPLLLPEELDADTISAIAGEFLNYFIDHSDSLLTELRKVIQRDGNIFAFSECHNPRVRTNLLTMRWAFQTMIKAAKYNGASATVCERLAARFDEGLSESVDAFNTEMKKLEAKIKKGNLAFILLQGYQNESFGLMPKGKKSKHLSEYDGMIFHGDLCLRSDALRTFVRQQDGYHDWTLNKIVNKLMDYGAICIQEESTKQVKISKKGGVPRVYRIDLDALKREAAKF